MVSKNLLGLLLVIDISLFTNSSSFAAAVISPLIIEAPGAPASRIIPSTAIGADIDGLQRGGVAATYTPSLINAMRSIAYYSLAYRLRSELAVESWHWNSVGTWSNLDKQSGYWMSSLKIDNNAFFSNGYRLPRRGDTIDQANNDGYSRIDDNDKSTYWKSNPYLDKYYTQEENRLHPQWVVVDFGKSVGIDTVKISWAKPFATKYRVEYWPKPIPNQKDGIEDTFDRGNWKLFPNGGMSNARGGDVSIQLSNRPLRTRFIRILMTCSSETALQASTDIRDSLGYAVRELYAGTVESKGRFQDLIQHGRSNITQSCIYVSSVDPWHTHSDRDTHLEQPGFELVNRSNLARGLPILFPIAMIYDTPENAVSELRFLESQHIPIRGLELGEEPDGQLMTPEDYGALYVQFARALLACDPKIKLGGPSLQSSIDGWRVWPDRTGQRSWVHRFLRYLKFHGALDSLGFFSFEWYPFDDVTEAAAEQLAISASLLRNTISDLNKSGVSRSLPLIISEYGYSSFAGEQEVDLPGALLNVEIAAQFLTLGGSCAYMYGLEPASLDHEKGSASWGNLTLLLEDRHRKPLYPMPTYYGAQLLVDNWLEPHSNAVYFVYLVTISKAEQTPNSLISAFAVQRPDKEWAILIINKNPRSACKVQLLLRDRHGLHWLGDGNADVTQYGPAQYLWHSNKGSGFPFRDEPPVSYRLNSKAAIICTLPPYSITVVQMSN